MAQKKYTVAENAPRIEEFLKNVFKLAGFQLSFSVAEGETPHPDFENPDLMVRFTGPDVDLLLSNKAELLLALEQLTMEAIGMAPEEHSRICFDANDRRILRIEELRMSAQAACERVKKSRQPFHFSPMNSRERRILHIGFIAQGERGRRPHPPSGDRARGNEDSAGAGDPAQAASGIGFDRRPAGIPRSWPGWARRRSPRWSAFTRWSARSAP